LSTYPTSADPSRRSRVLWQLAIALLVCGAVTAIAAQTAVNLRARGIATGFGYLGRSAGFEIAPGPVPFSSSDTNARALAVGVVNTVRLALLGVVTAGILGVAVGIARLSSIAAVATLARAYVDAVRNVPLLLQILCWAALLQRLPDTRMPWQPVTGMALTNRALSLFGGRMVVSPEFAALFAALSIYTAAFIAENVRGGILAVPRGQQEAALSLGLSRLAALRAVVLPQALPVITPPTVSQFVSLIKNSSLATAIGYADLMSITNTTINQTGQAVEAIAIATLLYLAANLAVAMSTRGMLRKRHAA
jgi:general L-amino acid transport system permease protein